MDKLKSLEKKLKKSYNSFLIDSKKEDLFLSIEEITEEILKTKWKDKRFQSLDFEETVYDYSVELFQRILEGNFFPVGDNFNWISYIDLNLTGFLFQKLKETKEEIDFEEILDSLSLLERVEEEEGIELVEERGRFWVRIWDRKTAELMKEVLNIFYPEEKLNQLLLKAFLSLDNKKVLDKETESFLKFCSVLYKRIFERLDFDPNNPDIDSIVKSSLFLASIICSDYDNRLFLSLDTSNLFRLSMLCGGDSIYIPTIQELENLIASSYSVWEFLKGKDLEKAKLEAKKFMELGTRVTGLDKYVKNLFSFLKVGNIKENRSRVSVIGMLVKVIGSLSEVSERLLEEIEEVSKKERNLEKLLSVYSKLTEVSSNLQTCLLGLEKKFKDKEV